MSRVFFLSLPLIIALSELLLHFVEPPRLLSFVQHDAELGHRGPKNQTINIWGNPVVYGPEGFRWLPQSGSQRNLMLWLGDSMVEAITIPDQAHFLSLLERKTGFRQAMLAAGDWGTVQELLAFRRHGAAQKPSLVVLGFSSLTDFVNNQPRFANRYQSHVDHLRPYAREGKNGVDIFYLQPWTRWLRDNSRIFLFLDNALISRRLSQIKPSSSDCKSNINALPLEAYLTTRDPEWKESLELTALVFRELKKEVEKSGGRFLAVFLPSDFDLLEEKWRSAMGFVWSCFPGTGSNAGEIEKKFFEAARVAGVEAISLRKALSAKLGDGIFLEDGHYNEIGHRAVAEAMAQFLKESDQRK